VNGDKISQKGGRGGVERERGQSGEGGKGWGVGVYGGAWWGGSCLCHEVTCAKGAVGCELG